MTDDCTLTVLDQIAQALRVPVSALSTPAQSLPPSPSAEHLLDTSELFEAFARITDPKVRRACVAFVSKAASP